MVSIPVVASNRINDPDTAERIIASGQADAVSMARPLLADSEFVNKAAEGRADEINTCIACNQACLDHTFELKRASCLVNPRACHETELVYLRTATPKKVAVVGAGPAGLACATVAAERGHDVTLFDQAGEIGGQFNMAKVIPGKEEFHETLRYFQKRIERTGVKVVVVDPTGKLLEHTTIFPHQPKKQWDQSLATLAKLCAKHDVSLIAIGNGTASRETDKLAGEVVKQLSDRNIQKIMVSEAGASVYSASEMAAREFPDLDVSFRGAVSIARRLQDPLAELVKIDPKSIGVGQYQHDVSQVKMSRSLDAVVEDCVNAVGVDVNTASAPLLARIAGLNTTIAGNIVTFREKNGAFSDRGALKQVPRLGEKTFEQAAGFLRIMGGANPLDASSVHPEAYPLVERIAEKHGRPLKDLIGDAPFLKKVNAGDFTDDVFGLPTVTDILSELEKPGRDPRPEFKAAEFKEGVETLNDLKPGMLLEGSVTNVTNFGAFVDVGVHQDGLVHVSALADKFVEDPHDVVKPGDIVKVKVMEVDLPRKRISLTMRLDERHQDQPKSADAPAGRPRGRGGKPKGGGRGQSGGGQKPAAQGALGAAFAKAFEDKNKRG